MTSLEPGDADAVCALVRDAADAGTRLEISGGGSKAEVGAPREDATILSMARIAGIVDYDPAELVLTARAGTLLSDIEAAVAAENQMLAFDPFDHGPLFGRAAGAATIGGVVAAGVAGSGRLAGGACRDHLLGFGGVSGRGEAFVGGAKVVKNVTGYDLPKLMAGSWGRLAALTEVTLKVLPAPRTRATIVMRGLEPEAAVRQMATLLGGQADISAAAYLPRGAGDGASLTALRIQGFGPSVDARCALVASMLGGIADAHRLEEAEGDALWTSIAPPSVADDGRPLWRVLLPPSGAPAILATLKPEAGDYLLDWAGGLIWLVSSASATQVRGAAQQAGGHAMLVRAPEGIRRVAPALHPQPAGVAALEARVRHAFDPKGVFDTARFLDERHAH